MTGDIVVVAVFVLTFLTGIRSTWHLWRIHRETQPHNRITQAFFRTAAIITLAAGFFGFLSVRRWLGFDPIPGAAVVSVAIASAVLLIPLFLDLTVQRIRVKG